MRTSGVAILVYGCATIAAGVVGYLSAGSWIALSLGILAGLGLLVCGRETLRGAMPAGFAAAGVAMLLGLFFGYSFIATGDFLPGGLMLVLSFVTLFFVLIGLFTTLAKRS